MERNDKEKILEIENVTKYYGSGTVVTKALDACPCGDWHLEVWDVYADGVFQRTEYKIF